MIGEIPFRPVFDAAGDSMLLLDDEPRILAANPAAAALLQRDVDALVGRDVAEIAGGRRGTARADWRRIIAGGSGRVSVRTGDGERLELDVHVTPGIAEGVHLAIIGVARRAEPQFSLTARQEDTLRLVCDGATNREIAIALGISEPTVQKHIAAIKDRLGASTRAQVVALALQREDLAQRIGHERLYVHQAIRNAEGRIVDTRLVYISHETQSQQPQIAPYVGQPMSAWFPEYENSDLLALLATAIETGEAQIAERMTLRPPWQSRGYAVSGIAAPIGPDRAVFIPRSGLAT